MNHEAEKKRKENGQNPMAEMWIQKKMWTFYLDDEDEVNLWPHTV